MVAIDQPAHHSGLAPQLEERRVVAIGKLRREGEPSRHDAEKGRDAQPEHGDVERHDDGEMRSDHVQHAVGLSWDALSEHAWSAYKTASVDPVSRTWQWL